MDQAHLEAFHSQLDRAADCLSNDAFDGKLELVAAHQRPKLAIGERRGEPIHWQKRLSTAGSRRPTTDGVARSERMRMMSQVSGSAEVA
jgi:hypothetical protein